MNQRPLGQRLRKMVQTGVLSALLVVQALQGVSATTFLESPLPHQSKEVASQIVSSQTSQKLLSGAELVNPLSNPELAHIENLNSDHGIYGAALITRWQENNIDAQQILELTQVLVLTQSPTLVRSEQAKQDAINLAKHTQDVFSVSTQDQAVKFLENHSVERLEQDGWLVGGTSAVNVRSFEESDFDQVMEFWENYASLRKEDDTSDDVWGTNTQSAEQFQAAIQSLQNAVDASGLNSLKVPLPMWNSPARLHQVSVQLMQANMELQNITGWDGQVLGLKNNLNLTIGMPYNLAVTGLNKHQQVDLQAPFDILAHEWSHGLDYMLAKEVGYTPSSNSALLTHAVRDNHVSESSMHTNLTRTWKQLDQGIAQHTQHWQARMVELATQNAQDFTESAAYLSSASERLAYNFDAIVSSATQNSVFARATQGPRLMEHHQHHEAAHQHDPQAASTIAPSLSESLPAKNVWTTTFHQLESSWWNNPSSQINTTSSIPVEMQVQSEVLEVQPPQIQVDVGGLNVSRLKSWRQQQSVEQAAPTVQQPRLKI